MDLCSTDKWAQAENEHEYAEFCQQRDSFVMTRSSSSEKKFRGGFTAWCMQAVVLSANEVRFSDLSNRGTRLGEAADGIKLHRK